MFKVMGDARCPNAYYEEIMERADFNKMTKTNLVAFININSDADNQVTSRPRKSTLVRIAEKIRAKYDENPPACAIPKTNEDWITFMTPKPCWTWREWTVASIVLIGVVQFVLIGAALIIDNL